MIFRNSWSQRFSDKDNMSTEKAFEGIKTWSERGESTKPHNDLVVIMSYLKPVTSGDENITDLKRETVSSQP
jgi:hypothetical protein